MIKRATQKHPAVSFDGEMRKPTLQSKTVADWRRIFSGGTAKQKLKPKPESETLPKAQDRENAASLAVIKRFPIIFQIRREENLKDYERMAFVCRACLKNAVEQFRTVIHVERTRTGSRLVASDGRRLHVAHISKRIASGNYKPLIGKDCISLGEPEDSGSYPNWLKVVPHITAKLGSIDLTNAAFRKDQNQTEKLSLAFNTFIRLTGVPVNLRYLEDLTKKEWSVHGQEDGKVVLLYEEGTEQKVYAVIMPIRQSYSLPVSAVPQDNTAA
jgi:hypothetical protein